MATRNSAREGQSTPVEGVTQPSTALSSSKDIIFLESKITQLKSLLMCSYGVGAEWMEDIGETHRDNILWLASDLAEDIGAAFDQLRKQFAGEVSHG